MQKTRTTAGPHGSCMYTADKLFDGEITAGHEWISWFATQIEFPITFVVDMGQRQVFTKFRISDYSTHQGNYRDYEIYTAKSIAVQAPSGIW